MTEDRFKRRFFRSSEAFRKWLEKNHDQKDELWVGLYKKASGKGGLTYREAVDQALCFGWIDTTVKGIDETRYMQRFTPRKKGSIWSAVNIERVGELTEQGLMHPAGLRTFETRDPTKQGLYSFENPRRSYVRSRRRPSERTGQRGSSSTSSLRATRERRSGGWSAPNEKKRSSAVLEL